MILRHGRCLGLRLFRLGRKQLEVWFAPKDERIESHVHRNMDSKIVLLVGRVWGTNGSKTGRVHAFTSYLISAGTPHSAYTLTACAFLNFETWMEQKAISSACIDFESA